MELDEMLRIPTRDFGELECLPEAVIDFPVGLPAFEEHRQFVLIEQPATAPVVFLQSLHSIEVCFYLAPVSAVTDSYDLELSHEDARLLALKQGDNEPVTLVILAATESGQATANLLAPVVINAMTRRAVQALRNDDRYSHIHPLGEPRC
jgi:flagellar assembly factor FliW